MALKKTIEDMKTMLHGISHDLEKACRGNKAASQRVRTKTIKFAKVAKAFRKESIADAGKVAKASKAGKKKTTAKKKPAKKAKAAPKRKVAAKKAPKRKAAARRR